MSRLLVCFVLSFVCSFLLISDCLAVDKNWQEIVSKSEGQKVYFNGWGGKAAVNDYVQWAAEECKKRYNIDVQWVKVQDITESVSRVLTEKSANRNDDGSVDLMWINGENFRTMKEHGLLSTLNSIDFPNYKSVDWENNPSMRYDFSEPVDDLEMPWGMAQLVFMYDTEKLPMPPKSMVELLSFAQKHPGKFTYPAPPSFYGTTFLKQILLENIADKQKLQEPVSDNDFDEITAPVWSYLDELHPFMWQGGKRFVSGAPALLNLLDNSEVLIAFSFNPAEADRAINNGEIPDTVRSYVHSAGSLGNSHFLAIPYNSSSKEAAKVFINFLLSPEAQARKNDPAIWGDPTVLAMERISVKEQKKFSDIIFGDATLRGKDLGEVFSEPHSSWVEKLEKTWLRRYSK
ncbi:MAG: ABC transporter substrate-binding protein [Desulfotalea sp.]